MNILIVPSWGQNGLFETDPVPLIENLLSAGHSVTLRPHREFWRRARPKLAQLGDRVDQYPNLHWASDDNAIKTLLNFHLLITDWSGSGFSFAFGTGRSVLFPNLPKNINNPEFQRFKIFSIEVTLRNELGCTLHLDEFAAASEKITKLWNDRAKYEKRITQLRKEHVFNFGSSAHVTANYLDEITKKRQLEIP